MNSETKPEQGDDRKLMLAAMEEDEQMKTAKSTPERRQIERDEDYLGLTDPRP